MLSSNVDIWYLWTNIQTQRRATFGQTYGIDYNAMFKVADVLGIDIDIRVLNSIQLLEKLMIEEVGKHNGKKYKGTD